MNGVSILFRLSLIGAVMLLSACAARNHALDRTALPAARIVVVLSAGHPQSFERSDFSWALLGPAFAAFGAGSLHSKETATADAAAEFTAKLEDDLRADGWSVHDGFARRTEPTELLSEYGSIAAPSGATVFDSVIFEGGYFAGPFSSFRPLIRVWVKLVDPASGKVLYAQRFIYGVNPLGGPERFMGEADDRYYFSSLSELIAHPDEAVAGLRVGLLRIADAIAQDLKSP
jgi:hypothetical protein